LPCRARLARDHCYCLWKILFISYRFLSTGIILLTLRTYKSPANYSSPHGGLNRTSLFHHVAIAVAIAIAITAAPDAAIAIAATGVRHDLNTVHGHLRVQRPPVSLPGWPKNSIPIAIVFSYHHLYREQESCSHRHYHSITKDVAPQSVDMSLFPRGL